MLRRIFFVPVLVVTIAACEHADPLEPVDATPTLESVQQSVFNTNCALSGCHAGPNAQQGLNLSEGSSRASLVNVQSTERPDLLRVKPGSASESYLVMKIEGASGIVGERMPLGRSPLSQEQISLVREWIDSGANGSSSSGGTVRTPDDRTPDDRNPYAY